MALWSHVKTDELFGSFRLDAECYTPELVEVYEHLASIDTVRLGDHAFITDGQHGYHKIDPDSPVRHLTAKCVKESFIDETIAERLSLDTHQKNLRSSCEAEDVLLTTAGTLGNAGIVTTEVLPANMDQDLARIHLETKVINPWYLVAFLNSRVGRLQSERVSTGQIQKHIALEKIREFAIPIGFDQSKSAAKIHEAFRERQLANRLYNEAAQLLTRQLGIEDLERPHELFYRNNLSSTVSANRIDAEYFQPRFQTLLERIKPKGVTIADVTNLRKERFVPRAESPFRYIEIGDVLSDGTASSAEIMGQDAPSRATWIVHSGDLITSLVRPIRRLSALIEKQQDGFVCSSGFAVLEPLRIPPEVLLVYLRLPAIAELLDLYTTASMYPAISTSELMKIPFLTPPARTINAITNRVVESRAAHEKSRMLLSQAKSIVDLQIMGRN